MAQLTTIRVIKNKNYTTMSNYHLRDMELSLKAKGLMSLMLSLPPNWDFSINGITECVKESRGNIVTILKELENHGYIHREQLRNKKNQFCGYQYALYEEPCYKNPNTEKPYTENCIQINTELNNNLINTLEKPKKRAKTEFKPPTIEEINIYVQDKVASGHSEFRGFDVHRFFDYYDAADWHKANGKKVVNWKQCLVGWVSRGYDSRQETKEEDTGFRQPTIDEIPELREMRRLERELESYGINS